jgi:hypothetical protein
MTESPTALIRRLDAAKHRFGTGDRAVKRRTLAALAGRPVRRAPALLRFHEVLCFMRAYPDDPAILAAVEAALARVGDRAARILRDASPAAARALEESAVAGTVVSCPLSLATARWLAGRFRGAVELDWEDEGTVEAVTALLPFVAPTAGEDTLVEVGVPVRGWLAAAGTDRARELGWLLARVGRSRTAAALYDQVQPKLRWRLGDGPASRTRARLPDRPVFFHRTPLRPRGGPLPRRLPGPPVAVRMAPPAEGTALRDAALAAVTVRYRELHGFTRADPRDVVVADAGRGMEIVWLGLPPAHRLPLRAHYGYLLLKNGVPVGYGDASCLFEWCEIAFNVFETFRQGESGHLFARLLGFLVQWLGIRVFHLSPYQLGEANDEALASGAFWFYYKLGFRPTRPGLARLAREEAGRLARRPGLRSSRETLARLAAGRVTLGIGGRPPRAVRDFDASLVARRAAAGTQERSVSLVARALTAGRWRAWPAAERTALARLAPILDAIPDLARWPARDRRALVALVRSKGGRPEADYLRRMRAHTRFRRALLALGTET